MKAVFLALLFVAGTFARSSVREVVDGPTCPLRDPLVTEEGPLNVTLTPILIIDAGTHGAATIKGLTSLKYSYEVNIIGLTADFEITLGEFDLVSVYADAVGKLDAAPLRQETLPSGDFTGSGTATLKATGVHLKAKASLFINIIGNRVGILTLDIQDLSFESLSGDLGAGFMIDGKPVDFAEWSKNFKANFEADFAAFKPQVTEKLRLSVNTAIGKFTLEELLEMIGNIGHGDDGECANP